MVFNTTLNNISAILRKKSTITVFDVLNEDLILYLDI